MAVIGQPTFRLELVTTAVAEGDDLIQKVLAENRYSRRAFGLRAIGDPESITFDHDQQRSLFGTAALALFLGCVERVDDDPQGITVEQAVNEMIYGPRLAD